MVSAAWTWGGGNPLAAGPSEVKEGMEVPVGFICWSIGASMAPMGLDITWWGCF